MPLSKNFKILETLHENHQITVQRAIRLNDKKEVILKQLKPASRIQSLLKQFANEQAVLNSLHSKHITKLIDTISTPVEYIHVFEDIQGHSLYDLLFSHTFELSQTLPIALSIARTMGIMHKNKIIHTNISPKNIIYNPHTKNVQLIDFSLCIKDDILSLSPNTQKEVLHDSIYMAPEQTGLTSDTVDIRTDFYNFGMTLYHLFLGHIPLETINQSEQVHKQIALNPLSLHELDSQIPLIISKIVQKLIHKNPQDRYQTDEALVYDLEKVLKNFKSKGDFSDFTINTRNRPHLTIGTQIFGRDNELKILKTASQVLASNKSIRGLISGHSGVGKTRLIEEFFKTVLQTNTHILKGKFEQQYSHLPYLSFKQIFSQLHTLIMSQEKPKDTLSLSMTSIYILGFIFPDLKKLLPAVSNSTALLHEDINTQLPMAVQELFKCIATQDNPLVIFMDDLQWADPVSIELLQKSILDNNNPYLHFIGAYRTNEIKENESAMKLMTNEDITFSFHLKLLPLDKEALYAMFTSMLSSKSKKTQELSQIIHDKTDGNPFYVKTLVDALVDANEINFKNGKWEYSIENIQTYSASKNIAKLINIKFSKLSIHKQQCLSYLSILGSRFNIVLTLKMMESFGFENELIHDLQHDGFIYINMSQYQFIHDQIQENIFALLSSKEKSSIHLKIGKYLYKAYTKDQYDDFIKLVQHLNSGYEDKVYPRYLFKYNLLSIEMILQNNAYQLALEKVQWIEQHLFNEGLWEKERTNTFQFKVFKIRTLYLNTQNDKTREEVNTLIKQAKTIKEKLLCFSLTKDLCVTQGKNFESLIQLGNTLLKELGINVPKSKTELKDSLDTLESNITSHSLFAHPNNIVTQTKVHTGKQKSISSLLMDYWESAFYLADINLMKWAYLSIVYASFKHGNTSESSFGYVLYGAQLVAQKEYKKSYLFSQISLKLNHIFNDKSMLPKVNNFVANFINPYSKPLISNVPIYHESLEQAKLNGDIVFGTWANFLMHFSHFLSGRPLEEVSNRIAIESDFIKNSGDFKMISIFECLSKSIHSLQNNEIPTKFNESNSIELWKKENFYPALAWYSIIQAQNSFLQGEFEKGLEYFEKYVDVSSNEVIMFPKIRLHFIRALLLLSQEKELSETQSQTLDSDLNEFNSYAKGSASNFKFETLLLQAEKMKSFASPWDVVKVYDKALDEARKLQNPLYLALAGLCAGRFWKKRYYNDLKEYYFNEALVGLDQWGASSLVEVIKSETSEQTRVNPQNTSSTLQISDNNFKGLISAFNTISKAENTNELTHSLMHSILQNATASKAVLILKDEEQFLIRASIDFQNQEIKSHKRSLEDSDFLPHNIISYIINTGEKLDLQSPSKIGKFQFDKYIQAHKPASCMCIPTFFEGTLKGVLYLENTEVLTPLSQDKIATIELLLTQAVIVYKNTSLYETLQISEDKLNKAQEISHVGSWEFNSENLNIVWSAETYRIYELEPFSIPIEGEWFFAHLHPDDIPYIQEAIEKSLNKEEYYDVIHRIILPNGKEKIVHQRAEMYFSGKTKMMAGTIEDITESEKSKELIARLSQVVEQTPFSILITDTDGHIIYTNPQAKKLTGYGDDELIGQRMNIFRSPVQSKSFYANMWNRIKVEKKIWQGTIVNKMKDESLTDCQSTIFPVFDDANNIINFVTIQEDTTQRNIKDKLFLMQTRQAQMGEMLSMIAHQWRQPLAVMSALMNKQRVDIALQTVEIDDVGKTFDLIESQIQHLSSTITDFRDFFKPDKKQSVTKSSSIISKSFSLIEHVFKQKSIKLEVNYINDISYSTFEREMEQVMLNLFKNAQDAFEEHKIKDPLIKITCKTEAGYAIIQVDDNANGINTEVIDTLFLPYVSTKKKKQGTGLGLYMSKTIVEEHCKGSITVKNIFDGARFTIKIPLKDANESE